MARSDDQYSPLTLTPTHRRAFLTRLVALGCCAPVVAASLMACQSATPPATVLPPSGVSPLPKPDATPSALATAMRGTPARGQAARLSVDPVAALVDTPVQIRLDGLAAGQLLTLRARMADSNGITWASESTFRADEAGLIDLDTQAPESGTYTGVDPMGLFWSMRPVADDTDTKFFAPGARPDFTVTLTAEADGAVLTTNTLERRIAAPGVVVTPIRDRGLVGTLYQPAAPGPHPGVLVLGGSGGGLASGTIAKAALFAAHGYAALALAYFGVAPLPATLASIPLEYFGEAIAWLQAQPGVRGDRLAAYGSSRGGDLALLLGVTFPALSAIVSVVGSGQIVPGAGGAPPWTYRGTPVAAAYPGAGPSSSAVIPVERIQGPVLLVSAEDDYVWPSAALSQIASDRLAQAKHPYPDQHLRYPKAGHGLDPPYFPTFDTTYQQGGTPPGNAAARADFWPRVLALLSERLTR